MNPTRFLALSVMALTMTPTASGRDRVRRTKKPTVRPTATTAGASATVTKAPTRVSSFGRLIRRVPTSSHLAHVVAHSHVCFFFLFAVRNTFKAPTARPTACVVGSACPSQLNNQYTDESAGQPCPEICTEEYCPVVGCDGSTYDNACVAHGNGVIVSQECVFLD